MDGLAMALHVLYYTNSFKDAIIKVVNLRGDSDSVGSVVGQIAGAYYGLIIFLMSGLKLFKNGIIKKLH